MPLVDVDVSQKFVINDDVSTGNGLSHRDLFAAFALSGLISKYHQETNDMNFSTVATKAYKAADCMLSARDDD